MQAPTAIDSSRTSFDLEYAEAYASNEEFPVTLPLDDTPYTARPEAPVIPTTCLSLEMPQGRLRNWQLSPARSSVERITPNHIIGSVVKVAKGRTSPIASIDPATRRIRTLSGSIYELGAPAEEFIKSAPDVLRCMGF
ncbi:MAG: hypothetical protein H6R19_3395 [Proteobacteria bacterium]|nr:hypothetical protein [Pseudomonadota bacterium]